MPKAKQSLSEILYDLKRIEEHREVLTESKIRKIYRQLSKDLTSFIAEEYAQYADADGALTFSTLQSRSRQARFLEEAAEKVDSISPKIKSIITELVETTYTSCYEGMQNALAKAGSTEALHSVVKNAAATPEVVKQSFNNSISKLTLSNALEKNRQEIIYNVKQELNIGLINGDRYEKMARRIAEKTDMSYGKSVRIARTESHRNIEAGQSDSAQDISSALRGSGMVYVSIWRSMGDGKVRDAHASMDGKMIEVGDKFKLESGVYTKCPGNSGLARHDCNCRCFLEYDVMTEEEFEQKGGKRLDNSDESGIIKLQINLFDKSDPLWAEAFSMEEEDGFENICMHGSSNSVQRIVNGSPKNYTAKEFAEYLKNSDEYNGGDLKLLSCSTGKGKNSFAQQLSKELGITVKAPDDDVYYAVEEGIAFVGSSNMNTGKWRVFKNGDEING